MFWLSSFLLMPILPGGHAAVVMEWRCGDVSGYAEPTLEPFASETIDFATKVTKHNCSTTRIPGDGYRLFVDASRLITMCPRVTFYLDGVKVSPSSVACTNMSGVAVATVVTVAADYVKPTGGETVEVNAFYELNTDECQSTDEGECCQRQARVLRKLALCDTNRCFIAELLCDDIVHCEHGGDEAVWCRVWAWWVWVVAGVVGMAVVALLILTVVVVVKKVRKRF